MNDDFLRIKDDEIGIDPTTLSVIDSLDAPVPTGDDTKKKKGKKEKTPKDKKVNPDAKPGDGIKKILLIFLIIALMGGVAFGIYFYLNLGTKKNAQKAEKKYNLEDKYITVGDILSDKISDYGDFQVDIKTCRLDTDEVDTTVIGDYPYYITCGDSKYTATIHVLDEPKFNIRLNLAVTTTNSTFDIHDLFTTDEEYTAEVFDQTELEDTLKVPGFRNVNFVLYNSLGQSAKMTGFVYVFDEEFSETLSCNKAANEYTRYSLNNTMYFSESGNIMKGIKTYSFELNSDDMDKIEAAITDDGKITFEGATGYAILNVNEYHLDVVAESSETYPYSTKSELKNYYTTSMSYECN